MGRVNAGGEDDEGYTSYVGLGGECFADDSSLAWYRIWAFEVYESKYGVVEG